MPRLPVEERRQQLVDAAIRVMTRDGVSKATTRAISAEAQVSLSVFHYCFDSKQDLLAAVIDTIVSHTESPAKASIEPGLPLRDAVRSALAVYWSHVVENPEEHLLTYELTQFCMRHPDFREVASAQYARYAQAYVEVFDSLSEVAEVDLQWPVEVLANYVSSQIDGLTLNWLAQRDDARAEEVLDRLADQVSAVLGQPV